MKTTQLLQGFKDIQEIDALCLTKVKTIDVQSILQGAGRQALRSLWRFSRGIRTRCRQANRRRTFVGEFEDAVVGARYVPLVVQHCFARTAVVLRGTAHLHARKGWCLNTALCHDEVVFEHGYFRFSRYECARERLSVTPWQSSGGPHTPCTGNSKIDPELTTGS